ncbi:Ankyrin repeat protein [Legionella lansingensis]|uniref:Ankyrin repeat protein n=1 Tax=Legionella lansingensis TaxID=45067 RepID=A0A0W0VS52_9GAMM|nr:ankyrin repeat domain-containing protein [Legionella lansingensis]KTD22911.1 Ankyrin repeat protein [Legionella lansingensis]SNV53890.1 Ankyrin repeat protein [Legionella lansingensis]
MFRLRFTTFNLFEEIKKTRSAPTTFIPSLVDLKKNIFLRDKCGNTPLHLAAITNHFVAVQRFLELNRPHLSTTEPQFGNTPLLWGIANSSIESVMLLLNPQIVTDKNEMTQQINQASHNGNTPLILSIAKGWEHKDSDRKSERFQSEVAMQLLKLGANVHAKDRFGRTALHYACLHRNKEAIEALVERGADLHVKDLEDVTPLDMKEYSGYKADEILRSAVGIYTRNHNLWAISSKTTDASGTAFFNSNSKISFNQISLCPSPLVMIKDPLGVEEQCEVKSPFTSIFCI